MHSWLILIYLVLALSAGVSSALAGSGIYKVVGPDGRISFTDKPPDAASGQKAEALKITTWSGAPATGNNGESVKRVTLISAQWCGQCTKAKAYMKSKGIVFDEWDIDVSDFARGKMKALKAKGVPVILYQSRHMVGFSPESFEKLLKPGP
ncbi:MAG: glutaredoxin family protein [Sulfuricella sp.]|nr:glutaredoxin family protein [Sulfuricella sp.]